MREKEFPQKTDSIFKESITLQGVFLFLKSFKPSWPLLLFPNAIRESNFNFIKTKKNLQKRLGLPDNTKLKFFPQTIALIFWSFIRSVADLEDSFSPNPICPSLFFPKTNKSPFSFFFFFIF